MVFGHTHKPFERVTHYQGFTEDVKLYNSGGWVVDSLDTNAPAGWAVILLDEDLNAASLRFPSRIAAGSNLICVAKAEGSAASPNPLHERLVGMVDATQAPWTNFVEALKSSVADHVENLKAKINSLT